MSTHWTDYWKLDSNQSSLTDLSTQPHELMDFWHTQTQFPETGATILDVGCGNGVLESLLNRKLEDHTVYAIDQATISNQVKSRLPHVKFLDNSIAEKLPFQDKFFDLIISQFAFEYCNHEKSSSEAFRTLKKDGRIAFICHTNDSEIYSTSQNELEFYNTIFDSNIFQLLTDHNESHSIQLTNLCLTELKSIAAKDKEGPSYREFVNGALHLIRSNKQSTKHDISTIIERYKNAHLRSIDMCNAALTNQSTQRLQLTLQELGFKTIETIPLFHNGLKLGISLTAQK